MAAAIDWPAILFALSWTCLCWVVRVVLSGAVTDRKNAKGLSARAIICAIGLCMSCESAFSQSGPSPPPRQVFYSGIGPLTGTIAREQGDPRPTSSDNALRALDWLING